MRPVYTPPHAAAHAGSAFLTDRADGNIDAWAPVARRQEVIGWAHITYSLAERALCARAS
jgi:hypothetical protein